MKAENRTIHDTTGLIYDTIFKHEREMHKQLYSNGIKLLKNNFDYLDNENIEFVFDYKKEKILADVIKIYITAIIRVPYSNFGVFCVKYYRNENKTDIYKI